MYKKITLVNMNLMYANIGGRIDRQVYIPLGLLYLAAVLRNAGYEVEIRDYQLSSFGDPFKVSNFVSFLDSTPDIVGFSCMANLLPFTVFGIQAFKKKYPYKTVIMGGVGPSAVANYLIEAFPFIDIVVRGEGEKTLLEIMKSTNNCIGLDHIYGISFRANGRVYNNPPQKRIENLDSIPLPAYDYLNMKLYDAPPSIVTSRGCPYKCAFCTENTIWGHRVFFHSIKNVIDEIRLLHETYQKDTFLIQDDNFVLKKERVLEFCDRLKAENLKIKWKCFARIDLMDEELMKRMAESGCIQVRYGIESGSNRVLEKIDKRFTIEQAQDVVSKSAKFFPSVHASFIWGYPLDIERMEDLMETINQMYVFEKMGATILCFLLAPLPQNQIYNEYKGYLDFSRQLCSGFVVTGHEIYLGTGNVVEESHQHIYNFITHYPHIFSGFYHYDLRNNVFPKLSLIKKSGFLLRKIKKIRKDQTIDL